MFSFLCVQAEVCAGTVAEVIQSVVNGADGCVFCFGHSKLGNSLTQTHTHRLLKQSSCGSSVSLHMFAGVSEHPSLLLAASPLALIYQRQREED